MVESNALLKRRSLKSYRGFESLPHRFFVTVLLSLFIRSEATLISIAATFDQDVCDTHRKSPNCTWCCRNYFDCSRPNYRERDEKLPPFSSPPEYVILRKLQFYREGVSEKHPNDIARMLESLGAEWDRTVLMRLIHEKGLSDEWECISP